MKVGFIGLGAMGAPMAQNIANAGHQVTVWNRSRAKADAMGGGTRVAATPADAAREVDMVVTMLADDAALRAVCAGATGMCNALPSGAVHVSCSTISVELSRELAKTHAERKQRYVAAPVFGRPEAAASAKLLVVAAGAAQDIERCRPVFEAIGNKAIVVGEEPEKANVVKLSGNFMIAAAIATIGQALALVRKNNIDPETWLQVVTETLFPGGVYKGYGERIVRQQYKPAGFRMVLGLKDVRLALAAAEASGVAMPFASVLRDDAITAIAHGMGDDDWAALARVSADRAGLK